MQLIEPEILAEASGLALGLSICGLLLGVAVWLTGWRRHRFWVVLTITLVGGVYGLNEAAALHAQPVVAGILMAVGAGMLALALARLFAFAAMGIGALVSVQALVPTWNQPLVSFVTGGVLGVLLFRLWVMLVTSLAGSLLMIYSTLCLLQRFAKLDAAAFAEKRAVLLNWICGGICALGLMLQLWLNRRGSGHSAASTSGKSGAATPPPPAKTDGPAGKRIWWGWPPFRKAG